MQSDRMVSVIIPTFGAGNGVVRAIESILAQDYMAIEIIIVDDNGRGTDAQTTTEELLEKYIKANNIKYYVLEMNSGGSAARNYGAHKSNGEYLMFLDDDDTVEQDKISSQVKQLQELPDDYGIAYCSTKVYVGNGFSNRIIAKRSGNILYEYLLGKIYIGTGTALLKREVWELLGGYDESFIRHQDWEFFSRVLNNYKAIATSNTYFNRHIYNRNTPKNIESLEKYADHYISFIKTYPFCLTNMQIRRVVNRINSRVALAWIKRKEWREFARVIKKYDSLWYASVAFVFFVLSVAFDKLTGKKS